MQAGQEVDSTTCKGNVALIHSEKRSQGSLPLLVLVAFAYQRCQETLISIMFTY
jgi:hypothetical protein